MREIRVPKPYSKEVSVMATQYAAGLEAFLAEAKCAYEKMFAPREQADLKTFSQREARVFEAGRSLSRFLLEAHLAGGHEGVQQTPDCVPCPRCQQPARRVGGKQLEIRPMTTVVGEVTFARPKYKCKACRKVFFPPRPRVGTAALPAQP
jgi:hypothetical protein